MSTKPWDVDVLMFHKMGLFTKWDIYHTPTRLRQFERRHNFYPSPIILWHNYTNREPFTQKYTENEG